MRLFKSGKVYNFMAVRWYWIGLSLFITFGALVLLLLGKAKLGTDFTGGTEVEIAFKRERERGRPACGRGKGRVFRAGRGEGR